MDGFGRELLDQYYKVGSSLEVMCQVDRLPARPLPDIIEWRHGSSKLPKSNSTSGQRYVIIVSYLRSVNFEMYFWCLHFLPKNERKQVDK